MRGLARIVISLNFLILNVNVYANNDDFVLNKLKELEASTDGRIGLYAINTENQHIIKYREGELFPMGCTSKTIGVAAVLKKSMDTPFLLSKRVKYSQKDLASWSLITEKHVSEGMTVKELCAASISLSDNTAMNLLLNFIGGLQGMTEFGRQLGDKNFSADNDWPAEAYSGGLNNKKDASTPQGMVESLYKLTMGDVLDGPQRDLLTTWLINSKTSAARIRSAVPKTWIVGNKTGGGSPNGGYASTNDLAIVFPPHHQPILLGVYYTSYNKISKTREDIVAAAAKVLVDSFLEKDRKLKK